MNNVQKLIEKWQDDLLVAIRSKELEYDPKIKHVYIGEIIATKNHIYELTLLLNEQPEAITDDAHFCKHDVGRSAASGESSDKRISAASSSETQAVGQNEQTKEDFYRQKYEKCIMVIKRFDAGIIGMYDL